MTKLSKLKPAKIVAGTENEKPAIHAAHLEAAPATVHVVLQNEPLLTRTEAASYLGISPQTLAADVSTQRLGVPRIKIGRSVKYRRSDLDGFIAANLHGVTTEQGVQS